jgi:hypothetical protein
VAAGSASPWSNASGIAPRGAVELELTRRGREAREAAAARAREASVPLGPEHDLYTLVLAPTGAATDAVRELYSGRVPIERLVETVELHDLRGERGTRARLAGPTWSFDRVTLARYIDRGFQP